MTPDENDSLQKLYLQFGIPSDQYAKRPHDLTRFIRSWNDISDRGDTAEDIQHYIKTKRKGGLWVTFDGQHEKSPAVVDNGFTIDHWLHLDAAYENVCVSRNLGSDNLDFDGELANELSREFAVRTGLIRTGRFLLALIMQKRKRGTWRRLNPGKPNQGIGFGDIDEVAS